MRILKTNFIFLTALLFLATSLNSCKECFTCKRPLLCASCISVSKQDTLQICNDLYAHDDQFYSRVDELEATRNCELTISGTFEEKVCGATHAPTRKKLKNSYENDLNYDCI